ncbi:MAG: hypothetical protein AAF830_05330 [Pseudomonadota bacterium]
MTKALLVRLRGALMGAAVFAAASTQGALAQEDTKLFTTKDPDAEFQDILDDIKNDGMSSVRKLFNELNLMSPQSDAAIKFFEQTQDPKKDRYVDNIGVIELGSALRQYYGYAYIGGNGWVFIRADFVHGSRNEWVMANFYFNSDADTIVDGALREVER